MTTDTAELWATEDRLKAGMASLEERLSSRMDILEAKIDFLDSKMDYVIDWIKGQGGR